MKTFTVCVERDARFLWWWCALGTGKSGWRFTERSARRAAGRAILEHKERRPARAVVDFEQWDAVRAEKEVAA